MFVSSVGSVPNKLNFKGYQYVTNNIGEIERVFHTSYDYTNTDKELYIEFYPVVKYSDYFGGIGVNEISAPPRVKMSKDGVKVDPLRLLGLNNGEPFLYRFAEYDKEGRLLRTWADSGQQIRRDGRPVDPKEPLQTGEYTYVSTNGTHPTVYGQGEFLLPDAIYPWFKKTDFNSEKPGQIYEQKGVRKLLEGSHRTFSNVAGGNFAGLEKYIDEAAKNNTKIIYLAPYANGSRLDSHGYWNTNNNRVSPRLGSIDDYESFALKTFKNGMKYVYDGTFTSEGLEGIHLRYALKWARKGYDVNESYMFNMESIKDMPLTLGVVPKFNDNFRVRFVNPPEIMKQDKDGIITFEINKLYDSTKPTYVQAYDPTLVSEEQLADTTKLINAYAKMNVKDEYGSTSYEETVVPYSKPVYDWNEVVAQAEKMSQEKISLDSKEGAIMISASSDSKFGTATEGIRTWDSNNDMAKMRHAVSAYDEQILSSINNPEERENVREKYKRTAIQSKDMILETLRYQTGLDKDIKILYMAQNLGKVNSAEDIKKLVEAGLLPEEIIMTDEQLKNIDAGNWASLRPSGLYEKDEMTVKSLMKYPLDSLELADDTLSVLSSSYIASRASSEEDLGKTRFELMLEGNPHIDEEHGPSYRAMNDLFANEIRSFADAVVEKLNEVLPEKLVENGEYTEYGEYVIDAIAPQITRFAILNALAKNHFKVKVLDDGKLIYNYEEIIDNTHLESLNINAHNPLSEAKALVDTMSGANVATEENIDILANAFAKQLKDSSLKSFRRAEAAYNLSGLGLDFRLDALKDLVDWDSVRSGEASFDDTMDDLIEIASKMVKTVKEINPNSVIMAELTDFDLLLKKIWGEKAGYDNAFDMLKESGAKYKSLRDAEIQLFNSTGITTGAGYPHFFSNLLNSFSRDFVEGDIKGGYWNVRNALMELIAQHDPDYIRNLFSFVGNQDKPRILHDIALDMQLFYALLPPYNEKGVYDHKYNLEYREDAMRILMGVDKLCDLPLELRLNIDNPEYFRTVNTRALAMSKLLRQSLESLSLSDTEKRYLYRALSDLTDGVYLNNGEKLNRQRFDKDNFPALYDLKGALTEIFETANILNPVLFNAILQKADTDEAIYKHLVVKEYYPEKLGDILYGSGSATPENCEKYDPYVTSIASLIKDVVNNSGINIDSDTKTKLTYALRVYTKQYTREKIEKKSKDLKLTDSVLNEARKTSYSARDIEQNIKNLIEHAAYLADRDGVNCDRLKDMERKEKLTVSISKNALTPALEKASAIMQFLSVLPGTPTMYYGDNLGQTGHEDKAKNHNLANRDVIRDVENETGKIGEWHREIKSLFEKGMQSRSLIGSEALNSGSCYMLDAQNDKVLAYLAGNPKESAISIMNLEGISYDNRAGLKDVEVNIPFIEFKEDSSLPPGTRFYNVSNPNDNTVYVVKYQDGKYRLYSQDGKNINIAERTMVLSTVNPAEKVNNIISRANEVLSNASARKYAENKGIDFKSAGCAAASAVALASVMITGRKASLKTLGNAVKKLNIRI